MGMEFFGELGYTANSAWARPPQDPVQLFGLTINSTVTPAILASTFRWVMLRTILW